jgi:predicted component of type VI protein secretion system
MNLLKSVESTIANLVEGAFGRLFRAEVRPMELARKLAREMDQHRTVSLSRVYAPNEYAVWLSRRDRAIYEGVEQEVIDELCAYLLEHARREELILTSPPVIVFHTDERLSLGEFGIQARLARPEEHPEEHPEEARRSGPPSREPASAQGHTMIYSTSARLRGPVEEERARRPAAHAMVTVGGRHMQLPVGGATIGRSRDCDIVLEDLGISRRHVELRPGPDGWTVEDLGSTNGVLVNGERVDGRRVLRAGDHVELGSTKLVFEVR